MRTTKQRSGGVRPGSALVSVVMGASLLAFGCLGGDLDLESPVTDATGNGSTSGDTALVTDDATDGTDGADTDSDTQTDTDSDATDVSMTDASGSTGSAPECEDDSDCVTASGCMLGLCDEGLCSEGEPAEDGTVCGTGRLCMSGECTQMAACASGADCPGETACREAAECDVEAGHCELQQMRDDGTECGENGEVCVSGLCGVPCDGPDDCGEAGLCETGGTCNEFTGLCRPVQPMADGEECGEGGVCSSGRCIPPGGCEGSGDCVVEEPGECRLQPACDPEANVCTEPAVAPNGTPCGSAAGQCVDGECQEECEENTDCPGATQCLTASACVDNACTERMPVDDGTGCEPGGVVDPDATSSPGVCLGGSCVPGECATHDDCRTDPCVEGSHCVSGACTAGQPRECGDGRPCQVWTCNSDRPPHEACELVSEVEVQVWFQDCDRDSLAPLNAERVETCSAVPAEGPQVCPDGSWVTREPTAALNDCNDFHPDVYPGQSRYFTEPIDQGPNEGSFDYDCDGVERRAWVTTVGIGLSCSDRDCDTNDVGGWEGTRVPACGDTGTWVRCRLAAGLCLRNTEQRTQACR